MKDDIYNFNKLYFMKSFFTCVLLVVSFTLSFGQQQLDYAGSSIALEKSKIDSIAFRKNDNIRSFWTGCITSFSITTATGLITKNNNSFFPAYAIGVGLAIPINIIRPPYNSKHSNVKYSPHNRIAFSILGGVAGFIPSLIILGTMWRTSAGH
jgi:hypothetical protein